MAEHGQNSSKDSRHFFLERSKDFKEKVKKVAPQLSINEVKSLDRVLSGLSSAVDALVVKDEENVLFYKLTVAVSNFGSSLHEKHTAGPPMPEKRGTEDEVVNFSIHHQVYLNTSSMNVLYNPGYFPNQDTRFNHSTVWKFTHIFGAYYVENFITPHATLHVSGPTPNNWRNLVFEGFSQNVSPLYITDSPTAPGAFKLYVKVDGDEFFLVPNVSVDGYEEEINSSLIVASEISYITGQNPYLWSLEQITPPCSCSPIESQNKWI